MKSLLGAAALLALLGCDAKGGSPADGGDRDAGADGGGASRADPLVAPQDVTVFAGSRAITFSATLPDGGTAAFGWSVSPVSAGTVDPLTGASTVFTPAAAVTTVTPARISAALPGGGPAGSGSITVKPAGSLTVTVSGPAGGTASVVVTGPGGFNALLASTVTLTGLVPGTYGVVAFPVRTPDPIVDSLSQGFTSGSPATVSANQIASVAVTYSIGRVGSLWVPGFSENELGAYTASTLASGRGPNVAVTDAGTALEAIAFDAQGNLWFADYGSNLIGRFAPDQQGSANSPTPRVVLTAAPTPDGGGTPGLNGVQSIAFDSLGNLWACNYSGDTVVEFTPDQLALGGGLEPHLALLDRVLADGGHTLSGCYDLAFDAQGTLWVANRSGQTVVAFSGLASLSGAVAAQPRVVLGSPLDGGPPLTPYGLAFDANGNLWVGNGFNGQLLGYSRAQQAVGGSVPPFAWSDGFRLDGGAVTQPKVAGLAFDNSGALWVTSDTAVLQLTDPSAWNGRVQPVPARVLPGLTVDLGKPAFNISPPNVPLP